MTTASPVTNNEFPIRMRASQREAMKKRKEKDGLTYTEFCFEVKEGKQKRVRVLASARKAKRDPWVALKFYTTDEQADFLIADAEKRGITVSRAVVADIFLAPKNPVPPVKAKELRLKNTVSDETQDYLAALRECPEYDYTKLMSEPHAFVEIASVLLKREALSKL